MSILDPDVIDFIAVAQDHLALIQVDAVEWGGEFDDMEHVYLVQENVNICLEYYQIGQHLKEFPEAAHLPVKIVLIPSHPLNEKGQWIIDEVRPVVEEVGLELIVDPDYGLDEPDEP